MVHNRLNSTLQRLKLWIKGVGGRCLDTLKSVRFWVSQGILLFIYLCIYIYAQSHNFLEFPLQFMLENINPILYIFGFSFYFICNLLTKILWSRCSSWGTCFGRTILIMTLLYLTYGQLIQNLFLVDVVYTMNSPRLTFLSFFMILTIPKIVLISSLLCTITYISYPSSESSESPELSES